MSCTKRQRGINRFEQAGFTASRFTNQVGKFSFTDIQADILQDDTIVLLADVDVAEFNDGFQGIAIIWIIQLGKRILLGFRAELSGYFAQILHRFFCADFTQI